MKLINNEFIIIMISVVILLVPWLTIRLIELRSVKSKRHNYLCSDCWYCYQRRSDMTMILSNYSNFSRTGENTKTGWYCDYPEGRFNGGWELDSLVPCEFFKIWDKPTKCYDFNIQQSSRQDY